MSEEQDFEELDSLNRLSEEEMEIFNQSIQRFINDPTDSKVRYRQYHRV
jgi:hypothetical protein